MFPKELINIRQEWYKKYIEFANNFISIVVGKKRFDNLSSKFSFSEFVSISDETFALLIFENNYERWLTMALTNGWKSCPVRPVYTTGGNVLQTPKCNKSKENGETSNDMPKPSTAKYQGWSVEGIKRFNELYDLVAKERHSMEGKKFEEELLNHNMKAKENTKSKVKARKNLVFEMCRHELWENNFEDNNNVVGHDSLYNNHDENNVVVEKV